MESLFRDLRFGVRILLRSRGITAAVVLALALGIGANSAMFSVVDAVLLHPVHYRDLSTLVTVMDRNAQGGIEGVSSANFLDWRARAKSFSDLAGWAGAFYVLTAGDHPEQITGGTVTANFFRTLGVTPLMGRTFLPGEDGNDKPSDAAHVCVIAYRMWMDKLGGDPNVLGRMLLLNQVPYVVVGVMPADFRFFSRNDQLWVPVALDRLNREFHYLLVVGRLQSSAAQASAEMAALARALEQAYPRSSKGWTIQVQDLREFLLNRTFRTRLILLAGALALVLVIACTNIASLLLARSAARTREIAVRISVGATRSRLVRQLLTESLLLSLAGGAVGLGLARALIWAAPRLLPPAALPAGAILTLNLDVVLFTLCVSLVTGILFGLAPALATTRPDVQETLKDSSRGSTGGRGRALFRRIMVTAEVAVALMLLATAGLMIASLRNLAGVDLGFNIRNVMVWSIYLPSTKYDSLRALEFHRRALEKIAALPGVESVSVSSTLPLSGPTMHVPFRMDGTSEREAGEDPSVGYASIDGSYVRTLGIAVKHGRPFTDADNAKAPLVAVVNEAFTRHYIPDRNPVGQHLIINRPILGGNGFEPPVRIEIVGVIGNVAQSELAVDPTPMLYVPHAQNVWRRITWFAVRTRTDPASLYAVVRHEMAGLDKEQPIDQLGTLDLTFSTQFAEPRFQAQLMGAFAALALLLAVVGIYGVNAQAVAQRRHEIGLRMALGATPGQVLRDAMGEGLKLTSLGIAVGIAGAFAIGATIRSLVVGVSATDPVILAAVAFFLALVAAAASYIPARRATHIDPAIALRQE